MVRINSVDEYIANNSEWAAELTQLRTILKGLPLVETIKWGAPVYTFNGKNIIGLGAFKKFTSIWFYQGVFIKDSADVLINANEGTTKALRQWRFSKGEIIPVEMVKRYILEAIENQMQGKEIKPSFIKTINLHPLITKAFKANTSLKKAFLAFSLAKQNEFSKYIEEAKLEKTKETRLQKIIPLIMAGQGLNDRYKK